MGDTSPESFHKKTEKYKNRSPLEQLMEAEPVFEEWDTYAKKKQLLQRDIDFDAIIRNSKQKIVAITGIRRSGKSSALMLLAQRLASEGKKVCYINAEDSRIKHLDKALDASIKWFGDTGYMLVDEITSAQDWEGWLARSHELLKGKLRLIVTSSRKSLVRPSRPLRGRILPYELYPLPFREFLAFRGIKPEPTTASRGRLERAFEEYLRYGGFPEISLTANKVDKVSILNAYFRDIIGLDIADAASEEPSTVEEFGRYVLQSPYFSASKCLNYLKGLGHRIGKAKILSLERYAQSSYLFFFTPIFSHNIKDSSQYPRKAYSGDTGFAYAATGEINRGRLMENLAFLALRRRAKGQQEINYWKSREGHETDFVVRQGRTVHEVIQVVSDMREEKTRKREARGLARCAKALKAERAIILTGDERGEMESEGVHMHLVPLMDWLLEHGI